jgi:hypothetical protein
MAGFNSVQNNTEAFNEGSFNKMVTVRANDKSAKEALSAGMKWIIGLKPNRKLKINFSTGSRMLSSYPDNCDC